MYVNYILSKYLRKCCICTFESMHNCVSSFFHFNSTVIIFFPISLYFTFIYLILNIFTRRISSYTSLRSSSISRYGSTWMSGSDPGCCVCIELIPLVALNLYSVFAVSFLCCNKKICINYFVFLFLKENIYYMFIVWHCRVYKKALRH